VNADPTLMSVAVLAALLLMIGGVWRIVCHADRLRGMLMVAAALVLIGNVLIWAWPMSR
jgi:hypothetical protein